MRQDACSHGPNFAAQRPGLASKPGHRTLEQIHEIANFLLQQAFFAGFERDQLLAIAYFVVSKHAEPGECVLSKDQPLEQWCLLLEGGVAVTRYSARRGCEQTTSGLTADGSWSEVALLHSSHPRRSCITVVGGPQGCVTLQLRHSDFNALTDPRHNLTLVPPEGTYPLVQPELPMHQRRAAAHALLCCCIRRLASARAPAVRTPEEAAELEPFLLALPAYATYPAELASCLAASCRTLRLPPGGLVYENGTLADAAVTV
ncbi:hypothetical protein Agub_g15696, partial [Astrephomene gubernaculifera]